LAAAEAHARLFQLLGQPSLSPWSRLRHRTDASNAGRHPCRERMTVL
jgi:hypothetical protein